MHKEPNYLYLMIGLLAGIVLTTSTESVSLPGVFGVLISALSLLVTAYILTERKQQMLFALLLSASAFLPFAWLSISRQPLAARTLLGIFTLNVSCWLLFTFYIGLLVFRHIKNVQRIRSNEIYGAIYVYLLIGILFAELYHLVLAWRPDALYFDPGRFPVPRLAADQLYLRGAGDVLYYSFVTLGTVGYGDVTPASPLARSLSLIEAVVGIMYVATMIARFVSIQTSSDHRNAKPTDAAPDDPAS